MYVKDQKTGIVHNLNDSDLKTTMLLRDRFKKERETISELNIVKEELTELKLLLQQLMETREYVHTSS